MGKTITLRVFSRVSKMQSEDAPRIFFVIILNVWPCPNDAIQETADDVSVY